MTPDSRTPEWQILHAVPNTAGTLIIDVLTRDAKDPSLTGLDQIVLNVRDPADRKVHRREYITRVMDRYSDAVSYWDVINEPVADDGSLRDSLWLDERDVPVDAVGFQLQHRLENSLGRPIDIVPFGAQVQNNATIAWSPNGDVVMNVMGSQQAYDHAQSIVIREAPYLARPVVTPQGFAILNLQPA